MFMRGYLWSCYPRGNSVVHGDSHCSILSFVGFVALASDFPSTGSLFPWSFLFPDLNSLMSALRISFFCLFWILFALPGFWGRSLDYHLRRFFFANLLLQGCRFTCQRCVSHTPGILVCSFAFVSQCTFPPDFLCRLLVLCALSLQACVGFPVAFLLIISS